MMGTHELYARDLYAGYQGKAVLHGVSLKIPQGKISVIIGANASGKSTLLKTLCRIIKPMKGQVLLNHEDVHKMKGKNLAKSVGLMPQSPMVPEGIKVMDLVMRGRYPHGGLFNQQRKKDVEAVMEALSAMGIVDLADRNVEALSGGQRQRVWIAMALAQETEILFLDEPTTFLDISYQIEILDRLMELNQKKGTTIVMVLHDLNLSARYAEHIFAMKNGRLLQEGSPKDVITCSLMEEIYNLPCKIMKDPMSGAPMMIPKGKFHCGHFCHDEACLKYEGGMKIKA